MMNDPGLGVLKRRPPSSWQKGAVKGCGRSLEVFLQIAALLSSLTGTNSTRIQNPHKEKLNGILGGSVLLPVNIPPADKLKSVEWNFEGRNGLKLLLVELMEGRPQRQNPNDRFGQRLELTNDTVLKIKDLGMDDGGQYSIRVKLISAEYEEYTFQLSVYEPVPEPKILPRGVSQSLDDCNVTLQCQVPRRGEFNISWKKGDAFRDSKAYHISDDGRDLHLLWSRNSSEPNITCEVTNPADEKSISFNLLHICQTEGDRRLHWMWSFLIFLVILLLLAVFGIMTWKKRRKMSPNKAASMMPTKETLSEPRYSEDVKRCPPEGDDEQEPALFHEPTMSSPSVYVLRQHPTRHSEQVM